MNQPNATVNFLLTFPKDQEGQEIKWRFMLTLSKPLGYSFGPTPGADTVQGRLIKSLGTLNGIDYINPNVGKYTVEVAIARTFNVDEVLEELKRRVEFEVLTEIVSQKLII